jgi:betaine reductase
VALISAITPLPIAVGASRIIGGRAIPHPVGDPALPADEERALRRMLVSRALDALTTEVQDQLVLPLEGR